MRIFIVVFVDSFNSLKIHIPNFSVAQQECNVAHLCNGAHLKQPMVSKNEPGKLPTRIIFFHPPAAPTITLSDTTCTAMAQNLVELVDYCCTVKCFGFFRIPDRTQKMWTICAGSLHTRVVHEVLHDLEEKFKSACVPEPKESAQYILAHAIGHKTVSMSICAT